MTSMITEVLKYLPFLWLLRFPVLAAVSLLWLGLQGPRSPLLRGLFDIEVESLWLPTLCCITAAGSIGIAMAVILEFAVDRYGVPDLSNSKPQKLGDFNLYYFTYVSFAVAAAAVSPILLALWRAGDGSKMRKLAFMSLGTLIGLVASLGVVYIGSKYDVDSQLYPVLSVSPAGYFDNKGAPNWLYGPTLLTLLVSFSVYIFVGVRSWWQIELKVDRTRLSISGLSALLILVTFLVTLLSVLSFFWDKLYMPEAAFVILLLLWGGYCRTDWQFKVIPRNVQEGGPQRMLEAANSETAILVAAAGGGIQMSAWTAQVLSGLAQDLGPQFAQAVRLISSVSGGSVGALYFLAAFCKGELDQQRLKQVFASASRSSLDFVSWGLIYPDLFSAIFPIIPSHIDRGWALEQAWGRGWEFPAAMDDWREAAIRGEMPAVLFNTTLAETGEAISIGTADLASTTPQSGVRRTFRDVYAEVEPSPVTAARLSAGFPFVTPASTPIGRDKAYHFVDGGYYDNYGTAALVTWLAQAVPKDGSSKVKRVLIIRISGAPQERSNQKSGRLLGWFYQVFVPFKGLLSVRTASQWSRQQTELELLMESMRGRGVEVTDVAFECPVKNPPLSWHMTKAEISAIEECWPAMKPQREFVEDFVGRKSAAAKA